jgi:SAM-dependent methyltransferase
MRREALAYLACPNCGPGVELRLSQIEHEDLERGHVMDGRLVCASPRACGFPIRGGVPILTPGEVDAAMTETAARFAEEWTRWTDLRDYYERQFLGWVAPIGRADFEGKVVFEGGCGKGRHTDLVARFGARAIVAVDLGESALVAFQNTRDLPNAHIVMADLTHPPVKAVFDLAFSVGVVHHLPDPRVGAESVASVLRDGGRLVLWVYGRENNEWIVKYVDPIRQALTSRVPWRPLKALSSVPAAVIWAAIRVLYRPDGPGARLASRLPYAEYFGSMRGFPFDELQLIVFDQLVTPVAHYLSRAEVAAWFEGPEYREVELRWHNQMSWTATAVRVRPAISSAGSTSAVA